jgi:hypothetical protein
MNNNLTIYSRLLKGVSIALLGGLLFACAAIKAQNAEDTEQLLAAAGFTMKLADTPEKLNHLKTLQQQKIIMREKDGIIYYLYADATTCQCLYIGQQASYQKFQQLQIQQNIAQDQQMTAEMNEDSAMDWGMWGYGMGGFY